MKKHINFNQIRFPGEKDMTMLVHILGAFGWIIFIIGIFFFSQQSMAIAIISVTTIILYTLLWPLLKYNAFIQGNGVLVTKDQYPEIFSLVTEFIDLFQLQDRKEVEVYVIQERGLNAVTIPAFYHNQIMLTSDIIESLIQNRNWDELRAVVGHELGHHFARHTDYWLLDVPMHIFPMGIIGLYQSRLAELTGDRAGYFLSGSLEGTLVAIKKLLTGPILYQHFNSSAYDNQIKTSKASPFLKLTNLFNTHPYLFERIDKLITYDKTIKSKN